MTDPVIPVLAADADPHADASAETPACALCGGAIAAGEQRSVQGRPVCASCAQQLEQELEAERGSARLPFAAAGGLAGALVGAGVWAAVAVFGNLEIGIIAVLVGFLAGQGARLGAGNARGTPYQVAAAATALVGLLAAKYFIFAQFGAQELAESGMDVGPFHPALLQLFPRVLPGMLSPFDLLWVFIALSSAWSPLKPSGARVEG